RFNDGTGTFNTGAKVLVHGNPRTVVPADVDDDGDMDLLTSNSLTNQAAYVSVRLNNGLGQFLHGADHQVGQLLGTPARKATSVAVADLDADGSLDFVTTNTNGTVSVRFNQGQGAFGGSSDYPVGLNPSLVTTGDVDGDGDLDLLVTDTGTPAAPGQTVIILLNSGSGAFPSTYTVSVAGNPNHIATGDLDADGDLDLLTAHPLDHKVCIRFNDGAGGFTSPLDVLIPSSHRTDQPHTVATADLDGDGDLDFYTANHRSVAIGLNDGSGYFTVTPIIAGTWGAACATAADLDGDHDLDLLFPDGIAAASSISIYLNRPVPPLGVGGAILPALSLNPNPARHYVRVLGAPARDIYLLNALGQVIRTCSLLPASPEATLDLTGIAPGVYFVRCGPDTRRLAVE
ncbi:MAG TPA: T9SS type A sorting domain-containing protein, partial [bacterium]|nr:T9SS type A sorting domain-containing protein [bacterium]